MPLRMPIALSHISSSLACKSLPGVLHSWPATPCKSVAHVASLSLLSESSCRLGRYEHLRFSSSGAQLGSGGTRSRPSVVAAATGTPPQVRVHVLFLHLVTNPNFAPFLLLAGSCDSHLSNLDVFFSTSTEHEGESQNFRWID